MLLVVYVADGMWVGHGVLGPGVEMVGRVVLGGGGGVLGASTGVME